MDFEKEPSFEEEKEVIKISQEDFDNLRALAAEDSESEELAPLLEQYGLEVEDDGSMDVEVNGEMVELFGFKAKEVVEEEEEDKEDGDIEMPEAA